MDARNPNHPKKGSTIKVEPISERKDIKPIKKLLRDKPRDYCLFTVGINTNLRASDLIRITAGDVRDKKPGNDLTIKEKKTGKERRIRLNDTVIEAVKKLLTAAPYQDTDPLFMSRKGNESLTVPSVNRLVKSWCREINLKGNYGSQKQTLDYLCIQPEEIKNAYMQLKL